MDYGREYGSVFHNRAVYDPDRDATSLETIPGRAMGTPEAGFLFGHDSDRPDLTVAFSYPVGISPLLYTNFCCPSARRSNGAPAYHYRIKELQSYLHLSQCLPTLLG